MSLDPSRADEARLRTITEVGGFATFDWNIETGVIVVSERWAAILGDALPDIGVTSPATWLDRVHPEDRSPWVAGWERHCDGETDRHEAEIRMRHRDGSWIWVMCRGRVTTRTRDGRPEWFVGIMEDTTERRRRDELLQTHEDLLDSVGEIAGVGGWELDLVSHELTWSTQTYRIYGVSDEFRPTLETAIAFYGAEAQQTIAAAVARGSADGTPWDLELPLTRADGRQIWVRALGTATLEGGRAIRLTGALQDVTARVLERQELRDANERLRLATDGGGIGLWDWDVVHDRLHWDSRMHALYDTKSSMGSGMVSVEMWFARLHPADRATSEKALRDAIAGVRPLVMEGRVLWHDGSVHHIRGAGTVSRDAAGRAVRMVGANWDATTEQRLEAERIEREREAVVASAELNRMAKHLAQAREAAERASLIQREQDRFRAAVDAMQGVLWTNDAAGRMTGEQPGWAALTGQSFADYQDYGWADAVHQDDSQPTVDAWNIAVAERRIFVFEHRVRRHDAAWRAFSVRAVPLLDKIDGSIREWVGVHTDITEQRQAEAELKESNAELEHRVKARTADLEHLAAHLAQARDTAEQASLAKSRFLAGMSHELRTPLNGILGYAQMLRLAGGLSVTQSARVDAMLGAGNHLLGLITSVLDMSEIEAGRVVLQLAEVDLSETAGECLDVIGAAAEAKGLSLNVSIARGTPRRVTTDPMRLRQVLLNLLGNAVKFTMHGGIELRLSVVAAASRLRIEVVDTGPGIAAELRARLFREFERLDSRATAAIEGSGLGLALSARLATLLEGQLGHDDRLGGGSVFWLELPLTIAGAILAAVPPRAVPLWVATPLRVLVVDDVAMNREIAGSFLASVHHVVTCVEGGADAISAASRDDYDVILMDVRMPEVDGLEATRRIRRLIGERGRVPIIGVTAQAFAEQVTECRAAGMDGHLPKPFSVEALLQAVAGAAALRQLAEENA